MKQYEIYLDKFSVLIYTDNLSFTLTTLMTMFNANIKAVFEITTVSQTKNLKQLSVRMLSSNELNSVLPAALN